MHAPFWQVSVAAHAPVEAQTGQPLAVAWQVSKPPPAAHWTAPTAQFTAQAVHAPALHEVPAWQLFPAFHTVQLLTSVPQVSTPLPLHRSAPRVQLVPQTPHAPPLQKLAQVWPGCQVVHPCASATQLSTELPAQRWVPAVQVLLQVAQVPPVQRVPELQTLEVQLVQPESTSQSQVCTPVAVHCAAPIVHASQLLHTPPAHSSPYPQVCEVVHAVQPLLCTWQLSAVLPEHRPAPAVQALVQVWQMPPTHADIDGQLWVVQLVQPVAGSSWQVCC